LNDDVEKGFHISLLFSTPNNVNISWKIT